MSLDDAHAARAPYHDDTVAGPEADEQARLLPTEQLEFEDSLPAPGSKSNRPKGWQWLKGPQPPRPQSITPFFASAQEAPMLILKRMLPTRTLKITLLAVVLLIWVLLFSFLLRLQLPIKDSEGHEVVSLECTDTLWRPKNGCGIDGIDCRPFSNSTFAFRCPAKCAGVQVLNPHPVGPLDITYRPFIIGGPAYRGDSFICGSAIHAGIISDGAGGCGRISRVGERDDFKGTSNNGIESIPFDSYFPLSFFLAKDSKFHCGSESRQLLLVVSLAFTGAFSMFSTSPLLFFPIFVLIFAHVSFVSDPPEASRHNSTVLPDHISMFAKRLLPALFCAVIIYRTTVRRTLQGLTAQFEKTFLWLGGFWFGALSNYTFDWIPIQRLTAHDLEQQPGAKLALALILVVLFLIIIGQVYFFWLEGRLLRYLGLYGLFLLGIAVCLMIPDVSLRIHHYIIGLLLLPGTSMQTRPSLVYQGILLGLFINGVARWDFDSILQTEAALREDGKFNSILPFIPEPTISFTAGNVVATFSWGTPPPNVDGISVLVNDVERDRAFFDDGVGSKFGFQWTRSIEMELKEYLRFAYVRDGKTLDYTKPGTLFGNGTWVMTEEVASLH
ncbi:hypothetical protein BS50DRAFT_557629 [Corynespora cassiicola Philippines]|uniref:LCCL domain-containing protein n=1 Tax=Corynespora cassiicola Philippines TaxID=1448308 RepID=A0A2T2NDW9_CORCC|nr:hypothetical protein BS50DRAFT_557629 [Corynespora cassiicola Philippines]